MNNDQELLTLDFGADTVTYAHQTFPTGALACQALNIPREQLRRLQELAVPLTALAAGLQKDSCDPALLEPAKVSAHEIIIQMQDQSPFCYLDTDLLHQAIDSLFTPDMLAVYPVLRHPDRDAMHQPEVAGGYLLAETFARYVCVLEHLGHSLEQYLDIFTEFGMYLDSQHNRKADGLAKAVAQQFPNLLSLDDEATWASGMNQSSQYIAMKDSNGSPVIGRRHHYVSLAGMLRADLFEGLAVGHAPKKCATCGRWFLTTDGRHTKYCGGIDPNSDKGLTCRKVGNRKGRENREKAEDHPLKALYETRCNSIRQRVRREKLSPEIGDAAKRIAKNKLNRAIRDNDYAQTDYPAEMELSALLAEAAGEVG